MDLVPYAIRNGSFKQAEAGKVSVGNLAREDEIRLRAYEIYVERGAEPGREVDAITHGELSLIQTAHPAPARSLRGQGPGPLLYLAASSRRELPEAGQVGCAGRWLARG